MSDTDRIIRYGSVNSGSHTWTGPEWAAVRALARDVVARAYERAKDDGYPGWEDYPELSGFDWAEVLDVADALIPEINTAERDAAMTLLAPRAEES